MGTAIKPFWMNKISMFMLQLLVLMLIGIPNGVHPTLFDTVERLREVIDELPHDPDLEITSVQNIRRHGYPAEAHVILTEDKYLLNAHRIPCGRNCTVNGGRGRGQPVLLLHGFLCSSTVWILTGPEEAIAYLLADAGYDVWMMNARGTVYSKAHVELSTNSRSSYWDFSWHEMGIYDLAAQIDYIYSLKYDEGYRSQNPNMIVITHSMGSTMTYVLLSSRPEYNERIAAVFNMAPVGYTKYVRSPLRIAAPLATTELEAITWLINGNEIFRSNRFVKLLSVLFCTASRFKAGLCENELFLISGYNPPQFNDSIIGPIMNALPEGTSTKTLIHYGQEVHAGGRFQQFNYGKTRNLERYGQPIPPEYNISKITVPIASYYGEKDLLSVGQDVIDFDAQLKKSLGVKAYPFEHLDFLIGIDADRLVYADILRAMAQFQ